MEPSGPRPYERAVRIGTHATLCGAVTAAAPAPHLRHDVNFYLGFRESGRTMRRRVLPSSGVVLVLVLDHDVAISLGRRPLTRHASCAVGLSRAGGLCLRDGRADGLLLELTPLGAARLFGVPGAELLDQIVPLDALIGHEAHELVARLAALRSWQRRFALLDAWLRTRITAAPRLPSQVVWAWHRLTAGNGQVPINTLVEELGCSHRHLVRCFGETVGMVPKTYGRIVRFERAIARLRDGHEKLSTVALDCGYYDQAHFNHDVRAFTGVPPTELLAELLSDGTGFGRMEPA